MELIAFIFSSFWHFLGFFFIVAMILTSINVAWQRYLGARNISKYGWPPEHCNSVGEFRKEKDDVDDDVDFP